MAGKAHIEMVAHVVGANLENNPGPAGQLLAMIAIVAAAFDALGREAPARDRHPVPNANPKKYIFPDYLVCLDDGKKFKSLRRHLAALGMIPDQYLEKWRLSRDYPMAAPNCSAARSALANASGLVERRSLKSLRSPYAVRRRSGRNRDGRSASFRENAN